MARPVTWRNDTLSVFRCVTALGVFLKDRERDLMFSKHTDVFADEVTTGICFRRSHGWWGGEGMGGSGTWVNLDAGLVTQASLLLHNWNFP